MNSETFDSTHALLAAYPRLPALLLLAQHTLVDRLHQLLDQDHLEVAPGGRLPSMDELERQYPELMAFLLNTSSLLEPLRPSQICQFAADLYSMASQEFWQQRN